MSAALTALLTTEAPRWLVLALVGLIAAAYGACGLLALTGRARHALARRRTRFPATPYAITGARLEVTS